MKVVVSKANSGRWRAAFIVALAVPLTLAVTLFADLVVGYTINRVTLFALILSLGYAFEQASRRRVEPRFLTSIEESPEIAPHLLPDAR